MPKQVDEVRKEVGRAEAKIREVESRMQASEAKSQAAETRAVVAERNRQDVRLASSVCSCALSSNVYAHSGRGCCQS
jgi:phage shock protein A